MNPCSVTQLRTRTHSSGWEAGGAAAHAMAGMLYVARRGHRKVQWWWKSDLDATARFLRGRAKKLRVTVLR